MWSFVDITGDDRLTPAEISRFLRVASEWMAGEQSGLQDAVGDTLVPPDALVQVLDDNRQVLKTWRLTPLRSELGPNESASFIGRLDDAPAGATNWPVVLADIE